MPSYEQREAVTPQPGGSTTGSATTPDQRQAISDRNQAQTGAALRSDAKPGGLPGPLRQKMERAFGADFSNVKINPSSGEAAALGAQAFARGNEIHIAPGLYDPDSEQGQALIGHELAHVVQQQQGRVAETHQYKGVAANSDPSLESQADRWGDAAAHGAVAVDSGISASAGGGTAQMKIGFEMQSTYQIKRIGKNTAPDSKAVCYSGAYFKIEVDRSPQPELEIVTFPLADRKAFDEAMREIEYVVGLLRGHGDAFVIPAGNGWLAETEILPAGGSEPSFRLQYTEGVTVEKIPSLIKQLHPMAWKTLPESLTEVPGGDMELDDKGGEKTKKRGKREERAEPEATPLRGLCSAICMYLDDVGNWAPAKKDDTEKYAHPLMARTDFHALFNALSEPEKDEFKAMFAKDKKNFYRFDLAKPVYGRLKHELTVRQWLTSIAEGRKFGRGKEAKDLMSPPPGLFQHAQVDASNKGVPEEDQAMKYAMGMYGMDGDKALFEARGVGRESGADLAHSQVALEKILAGTAERDASFAKPKDKAAEEPTSGKHIRLERSSKKASEDARKPNPLDDLDLHADYMPTPVQIARMKIHGLALDWVAPDGLCMLGALAKVTGKSTDTLRANALAALRDRNSNASRWLAEFSTTRREDVIRVLGDLAAHFADPAADAVLPVVALVADAKVTVIQPEGNPLPIHGGGTMLIRVRHPLEHYHSTRPAV